MAEVWIKLDHVGGATSQTWIHVLELSFKNVSHYYFTFDRIIEWNLRLLRNIYYVIYYII